MRNFIVFISLLCLISCKPKLTTLDFTFSSIGLITIPIIIEDSTVEFIFDTGASGSSIDSSYIDLVSINKKDTALITVPYLQTGHITRFFTYPQQIRIKDIYSSRKITFVAGNIAGYKAIAGMDIIDQYCWLFNFETKKVTVSKRSIKIENLSDWIKVSYSVKKGKFLIPTILNDSIEIGELSFDTGNTIKSAAGENIIIDCRVADSIQEDRINSKLFQSGYKKVGINMEKRSMWFIYDSIKLFGYRSYNCMAIIKANPNHSVYTGNTLTFGYVTKQFSEMYIDSRKKIMYLKPF